MYASHILLLSFQMYPLPLLSSIMFTGFSFWKDFNIQLQYFNIIWLLLKKGPKNEITKPPHFSWSRFLDKISKTGSRSIKVFFLMFPRSDLLLAGEKMLQLPKINCSWIYYWILNLTANEYIWTWTSTSEFIHHLCRLVYDVYTYQQDYITKADWGQTTGCPRIVCKLWMVYNPFLWLQKSSLKLGQT